MRLFSLWAFSRSFSRCRVHSCGLQTSNYVSSRRSVYLLVAGCLCYSISSSSCSCLHLPFHHPVLTCSEPLRVDDDMSPNRAHPGQPPSHRRPTSSTSPFRWPTCPLPIDELRPDSLDLPDIASSLCLHHSKCHNIPFRSRKDISLLGHGPQPMLPPFPEILAPGDRVHRVSHEKFDPRCRKTWNPSR